MLYSSDKISQIADLEICKRLVNQNGGSSKDNCPLHVLYGCTEVLGLQTIYCFE
jgi:hypothetical protein